MVLTEMSIGVSSIKLQLKEESEEGETMSILKISNLTKSYSGFIALKM